MKTFIPALLLLSVLHISAHAQGARPKTSMGDKGLIFSLDAFGDVGIRGSHSGSYPGDALGVDTTFGLQTTTPIYGIGMRFYLADQVALRASLGFNYSTATRPIEQSGNEDNESVFALGVSPALEFHIVGTGPVSLYSGVFASFGTSTRGDIGADSLDVSSSGTIVGAGALFGAEFFPWDHVSLGAEYQLGVQLRSEGVSRQGNTIDGPSVFNVGIGSLAVMLCLYI